MKINSKNRPSHTQMFHEAISRPPCVLVVPSLDNWIAACSPSVLATLSSLLDGVHPRVPMLVLATCSRPYEELPIEVNF